MIKAIIIDDEQHAINALQAKLEDYCPEVKVLETCMDVKEGISAIKRHKPDLIFLDINMPEQDGFDLLQQVGNIDFEIIFITAHDKYALRAFEFSALHFLLKPISADQLIKAIDRLKSRHVETSLKQVTSMMEFIRHQHQSINKIALPEGSDYHFVELKDIIRLQADSNYTHFYLVGNAVVTVPRTLKEYEKLLTDESFIRIHQSHLINLQHVKEYMKKDGIIMMSDGTEIELSTRKKAVFLNNLGRFIKL